MERFIERNTIRLDGTIFWTVTNAELYDDDDDNERGELSRQLHAGLSTWYVKRQNGTHHSLCAVS